MKELDIVALTRALPELGLAPGDIGTIVAVYGDGKAYEVEFMTLMGETIDVITLDVADVRPIREREVASARQVA